VRAATDIVAIVGDHVALRRAGREFKGLCPFHPDHRPSMAVVPHKQIFHCFVCGQGGDVFDFVQQFHKMTPGESLRMLAQRAGIKLPELPSHRTGEGPSARERLAAANEWACGVFERHLRDPKGKSGLDYLHARGLTDETLAAFRLGMAPTGWTVLMMQATRESRTIADLVQAGLLKSRQDGSPYDAFRGRVMFPIIDASGRIIAFGGRVLVEKRDDTGMVVEAKYLNSPDSPLFNKSESLYGLNLARSEIIRTRRAVVVEGYTDVIACHQANVKNVVATLGTALTHEHVAILTRYAQTVVLMFDSDEAGRRATDRALDVFIHGRMDVKINSVPDGKDPCDYCIKSGGDAFQRLVTDAPDALLYLWRSFQRQVRSADGVTAKQEATGLLLRRLGDIIHAGDVDPIRLGMIMGQIGDMTGMDPAQVRAAMKPASASVHRQLMPSQDMAEPIEQLQVDALDGCDKAEAWLLGGLLAQPSLYAAIRDDFDIGRFGMFSGLAAVMLEYFENTDPSSCTLIQILDSLPEGMRSTARALERAVAKIVEPAGMTGVHVESIRRSNEESGNSMELVLRECLDKLLKRNR